MTPDDLDKLIDALAQDAATKGDEGCGPGLITLSADTWCGMPANLGAACTKILRGIRYRGLRVTVRSSNENRVFSRNEATALGHDEFDELTAPPARD